MSAGIRRVLKAVANNEIDLLRKARTKPVFTRLIQAHTLLETPCLELSIHSAPDALAELDLAADSDEFYTALSFLLAAGANPNYVFGSPAGASWPLKRAALCGRSSAARLLLSAGADPNLRGNDAWTAPMVALVHGNMSTLAWMLSVGGLLSPRDVRACREAAGRRLAGLASDSGPMHRKKDSAASGIAASGKSIEVLVVDGVLTSLERLVRRHGHRGSATRYYSGALLRCLFLAVDGIRSRSNRAPWEKDDEPRRSDDSGVTSTDPLGGAREADPTRRLLRVVMHRAAMYRRSVELLQGGQSGRHGSAGVV